MRVEMNKIDLLIKNANVLTLDSQSRRAGSVAVTNEKIVGIWAEGEPPKYELESAQANVVDLHGATLTDPTTVNREEIKDISILATSLRDVKYMGRDEKNFLK